MYYAELPYGVAEVWRHPLASGWAGAGKGTGKTKRRGRTLDIWCVRLLFDDYTLTR